MRALGAAALYRAAAGGRRQSDSSRLAGPRLRRERKIECMPNAYSIRVRGVVQGVGFRPFVYRLARANGLTGWVLNGEEGVEIHVEGDRGTLRSFLAELKSQAAAGRSDFGSRVQTARTAPASRNSRSAKAQATVSPPCASRPTCRSARMPAGTVRSRRSPLSLSVHQLHELRPALQCDSRLPYDRPNTTMRDWPLDAYCAAEYRDPADRRFHAQPVACPACGPHYYFRSWR